LGSRTEIGGRESQNSSESQSSMKCNVVVSIWVSLGAAGAFAPPQTTQRAPMRLTASLPPDDKDAKETTKDAKANNPNLDLWQRAAASQGSSHQWQPWDDWSSQEINPQKKLQRWEPPSGKKGGEKKEPLRRALAADAPSTPSDQAKSSTSNTVAPERPRVQPTGLRPNEPLQPFGATPSMDATRPKQPAASSAVKKPESSAKQQQAAATSDDQANNSAQRNTPIFKPQGVRQTEPIHSFTNPQPQQKSQRVQRARPNEPTFGRPSRPSTASNRVLAKDLAPSLVQSHQSQFLAPPPRQRAARPVRPHLRTAAVDEIKETPTKAKEVQKEAIQEPEVTAKSVETSSKEETKEKDDEAKDAAEETTSQDSVAEEDKSQDTVKAEDTGVEEAKEEDAVSEIPDESTESVVSEAPSDATSVEENETKASKASEAQETARIASLKDSIQKRPEAPPATPQPSTSSDTIPRTVVKKNQFAKASATAPLMEEVTRPLKLSVRPASPPATLTDRALSSIPTPVTRVSKDQFAKAIVEEEEEEDAASEDKVTSASGATNATTTGTSAEESTSNAKETSDSKKKEVNDEKSAGNTTMIETAVTTPPKVDLPEFPVKDRPSAKESGSTTTEMKSVSTSSSVKPSASKTPSAESSSPKASAVSPNVATQPADAPFKGFGKTMPSAKTSPTSSLFSNPNILSAPPPPNRSSDNQTELRATMTAVEPDVETIKKEGFSAEAYRKYNSSVNSKVSEILQEPVVEADDDEEETDATSMSTEIAEPAPKSSTKADYSSSFVSKASSATGSQSAVSDVSTPKTDVKSQRSGANWEMSDRRRDVAATLAPDVFAQPRPRGKTAPKGFGTPRVPPSATKKPSRRAADVVTPERKDVGSNEAPKMAASAMLDAPQGKDKPVASSPSPPLVAPPTLETKETSGVKSPAESAKTSIGAIHSDSKPEALEQDKPVSSSLSQPEESSPMLETKGSRDANISASSSKSPASPESARQATSVDKSDSSTLAASDKASQEKTSTPRNIGAEVVSATTKAVQAASDSPPKSGEVSISKRKSKSTTVSSPLNPDVSAKSDLVSAGISSPTEEKKSHSTSSVEVSSLPLENKIDSTTSSADGSADIAKSEASSTSSESPTPSVSSESKLDSSKPSPEDKRKGSGKDISPDNLPFFAKLLPKQS